MTVTGFTGKGMLHESTEKDYQDRLGIFSSEHCTVTVLADGCSGSAYGAQAAELNIKTVNELFLQRGAGIVNNGKITDEDGNEKPAEKYIAEKFREAFAGLIAEHENAAPSDFCSTVIFAVTEDGKTVTGHCGDGYLFLFDKKGDTVFVSEPDNKNSSPFFTLNAYLHGRLRINEIPSDDWEYLVMFTDGANDMFYFNSLDMEKGVKNILLENLAGNGINSTGELAGILAENMFAAHYVFDDVSIICAKKNGSFATDETDTSSASVPVSLTSFFRENYRDMQDSTETQEQ